MTLSRRFKTAVACTLLTIPVMFAFACSDSTGPVDRDHQPVWPANLNWTPPDPATLPYATWTPGAFANEACVSGDYEKNPFNHGPPPSRNTPIAIPASLQIKPDPTAPVQLIITDEPAVFQGKAKGVRLYAVNTQNTTAKVLVYGNQLILQQEALDQSGRWMPIQTELYGVCGNGFCGVYLPPRSAWQVTPPRYDGPYKTKIRFVMQGGSGVNLTGKIYSNEFDAGIDPNLFKTNPTAFPKVTVKSPARTVCPPIQGPGIPQETWDRMNIPQWLQPDENKLKLIACHRPILLQDSFQGTQVYLINNSSTPLDISTQKGVPFLHQEALDTDGKWKPIEQTPAARSANKPTTVTLNANHAIAMAGARYDGPFKTRIRFALSISSSSTDSPTLYSNEFEGHIHPDQFVKSAVAGKLSKSTASRLH